MYYSTKCVIYVSCFYFKLILIRIQNKTIINCFIKITKKFSTNLISTQGRTDPRRWRWRTWPCSGRSPRQPSCILATPFRARGRWSWLPGRRGSGTSGERGPPPPSSMTTTPCLPSESPWLIL